MARKTKTETTTTPSVKPASKQDQVLALLRRQQGASVAEISEVTGWATHSVRGFMSGALKRRLKVDVVSEKVAGSERRYFVAPIKLVQ